MKKAINNILTRKIDRLIIKKNYYIDLRRYFDISFSLTLKLLTINLLLRLFQYKDFESKVTYSGELLQDGEYIKTHPRISIKSKDFSVMGTGIFQTLKQVFSQYNRFKIAKYKLEELNKDNSLDLSCKLDMYVLGECRGDEEHKANLELAKNGKYW